MIVPLLKSETAWSCCEFKSTVFLWSSKSRCTYRCRIALRGIRLQDRAMLVTQYFYLDVTYSNFIFFLMVSILPSWQCKRQCSHALDPSRVAKSEDFLIFRKFHVKYPVIKKTSTLFHQYEHFRLLYERICTITAVTGRPVSAVFASSLLLAKDCLSVKLTLNLREQSLFKKSKRLDDYRVIVSRPMEVEKRELGFGGGAWMRRTYLKYAPLLNKNFRSWLWRRRSLQAIRIRTERMRIEYVIERPDSTQVKIEEVKKFPNCYTGGRK